MRPSMHANEHRARQTLAEMLDSIQAGGRYVVTRDQALQALGVSAEALKKAVRRLVMKRRVAVPHRGFYVIVPMEYRDAGSPPPSWFIDDLMSFLGQPYYVGILSAAALHGAAHQQPQEFQVVTDAQLRPAVAGRSRIRFFQKAHLERTLAVAVKTETGTMRVATAEATSLDLFRYIEGAGHLGHVVTVLAELAERMDPQRLIEAAEAEGEVTSAQRLGHVLAHVGATELAAALSSWIAERRPRYVALRLGRSLRRATKDERFRVLVNEKLEAET
jgi:predicted transcriptional regulator of viral defense system